GGVIHQHVDPSPLAGNGLHHPIDGRTVAQVAGEFQCFSPGATDFFRDGLRVRGGARRHDDLRSLSRERTRTLPADSPSGTRHQNHFIGKSFHVLIFVLPHQETIATLANASRSISIPRPGRSGTTARPFSYSSGSRKN